MGTTADYLILERFQRGLAFYTAYADFLKGSCVTNTIMRTGDARKCNRQQNDFDGPRLSQSDAPIVVAYAIYCFVGDASCRYTSHPNHWFRAGDLRYVKAHDGVRSAGS